MGSKLEGNWRFARFYSDCARDFIRHLLRAAYILQLCAGAHSNTFLVKTPEHYSRADVIRLVTTTPLTGGSNMHTLNINNFESTEQTLGLTEKAQVREKKFTKWLELVVGIYCVAAFITGVLIITSSPV